MPKPSSLNPKPQTPNPKHSFLPIPQPRHGQQELENKQCRGPQSDSGSVSASEAGFRVVGFRGQGAQAPVAAILAGVKTLAGGSSSMSGNPWRCKLGAKAPVRGSRGFLHHQVVPQLASRVRNPRMKIPKPKTLNPKP